MTKQKNTKTKDKTTKTNKRGRSKLAPDGWPTRREAGLRIGKSERSIRRLEEDGELQALPDAKGIYHVDPAGLERHTAQGTSNSPGNEPSGEPMGDEKQIEAAGAGKNGPANGDSGRAGQVPDGATAAAAFAMFNAGKSRREVVVELKLAPSVVQQLHADWVVLGGGMILEQRYLDALDSLRLDASSPKALFADLGREARDADAYREMRFPCACGCGETIQFTIDVFTAIVKKGALSGWHLVAHADALRARRQTVRRDEGNDSAGDA